MIAEQLDGVRNEGDMRDAQDVVTYDVARCVVGQSQKCSVRNAVQISDQVVMPVVFLLVDEQLGASIVRVSDLGESGSFFP